MRAKLKQTSEGLEVVIDETLVRQLGIDGDTEVDVSTDGETLTLRPVKRDRRSEIERVAERVMAEHDGTFRKLAK
jgi:antitoxin component of MazEF toxin-antitoxin module